MDKKYLKEIKFFFIGSLGFTIIASIILGLIIGSALDKLFNTKPVLTIIFTFIGVISGLWYVIKEAIKWSR